MEKYEQELETGKFMLQDCQEAYEIEYREDIELAYDKICRIIKKLDKSKDVLHDVIGEMLGEQDTIDQVRQWN